MNKYHTPIHLACLTRDTEAVMRMLKQDRQLASAKDHEDTPLHCASTEAVARLLIAWGADVNARGWMGQTPLHAVSWQGHVALAHLLLQHGADINAERVRGDTPLHWAANADIAQTLLEHGASLDAQDHFGATPLHWAARNARTDVISLLLSQNADVHMRDVWGKTPLFEALGNRKSLSVVQLLLQAGADINTHTSDDGSTPLHEAIRSSQPGECESEAIVQLLLDSGADIHARDFRGRTPFHAAKRKPQLLALVSQHMEKSGPPPIPDPEQFVVEKIRLHPHKREAVTVVKHALLARWELGDMPSFLARTTTPYSRYLALAVSPSGETVALAPADEPVELRRWSDLLPLPSAGIPIADEATALAFSPDGRWLALANQQEEIYVIDRLQGKVVGKAEGGELTAAVLFDPSSTILASACSFQGGGHVRLDRVSDEGQLTLLHELWRSDYKTPGNAFVDSLIDLAFSPNGQWLALFESSRIYGDLRSPGWRGNIVLYDVATGVLQWQASIDAQVTGDQRSMKDAGYPMAFFTELLFISNTEIACGATWGRIVFYDVITGKLVRSVALPTHAAVRRLSLDRENQKLWVVLDNGKLAALPLF